MTMKILCYYKKWYHQTIPLTTPREFAWWHQTPHQRRQLSVRDGQMEFVLECLTFVALKLGNALNIYVGPGCLLIYWTI